MQQTFNNLFNSFNNNSKVWVYLSNRKLRKEEIEFIRAELKNFVSSWNSHGTSLVADYQILFEYFIVLVVDEEYSSISGCSIDKSVNLIKSFGEKFSIDFFNRLNILSIQNDELELIRYSDIKKIENLEYFNPMINNLDDLRSNWIIQSP